MKVLIVDDEQPARERIRRLIEAIAGYTVAGEAANGQEAVYEYQRLKPDIVLLDIRMPVMDGLEAARHLAEDETPPAIIFTTAYSDHALEAFDAHAVDYLLKPVRSERLQQALLSAQRTTRAQLGNALQQEQNRAPRSHICVRHRGNLQLIPVEDIYFFRAEDKYVTLHHKHGEALIEDSLVKLEEEFAGDFLRVHRNALVAARQIYGLNKLAGGGYSIRLKDSEETLEISRRHLATVRRLLKPRT